MWTAILRTVSTALTGGMTKQIVAYAVTTVKTMSDAGWWQACVRAFHEKMGQPAPEKYTGSCRRSLRMNLISEEVEELGLALGCYRPMRDTKWANCFTADVDEEGVVDALCDLLYVTFGTAVEMGVPLERFYAEVHRSNMTKTPGNLREDGKILKGPEYEPPRLDLMLERLKERGR